MSVKKIFYVGGVVRDRLMGKKTEDIDMVFIPGENLENSIKEVITYFEKRGYSLVFRTRFNTLKFKKGEEIIDVAMARREKYRYPAALPEVEPARSIEEDLSRRDFTINAMAMDEEGHIIDPFGGREHIKKRILIPISSFIDDPTRIFRGIRYARRFHFRYSHRFMEQMARGKRYIPHLSFARIKNELERITLEEQRMWMWFDIVRWKLLGEGEIPPLIWKMEKHIPYEKEYWIVFYTALNLKFHRKDGITRRERAFMEALNLERVKDRMKLHRFLYNRDIYIALLLYIRTGDGFFLKYFERRNSCRKSIDRNLRGEEFHREWLRCIEED